MDPLLGIRLTVKFIEIIEITQGIILSQQHVLARRFGLLPGSFISLVLRDTSNRYERVEKEVLNGADNEALTFKQSVTDECSLTAIAVSQRNSTSR